MGSISGFAAWDRGMFEVINKSMANGFLDTLLPLFSDFSIWLVPLAILWIFHFIRTDRRGRLIAIGCFLVLAILITGALGIALAFSVQTWAQRHTSPTRTALIIALEPVFAWITSYLVAGERLSDRGAPPA